MVGVVTVATAHASGPNAAVVVCAAALRHGPAVHAGLLGDGQRVVRGLRRAGAGGAVSSQQALHVVQLGPAGWGRGALQPGSDLTLSALSSPSGGTTESCA